MSSTPQELALTWAVAALLLLGALVLLWPLLRRQLARRRLEALIHRLGYRQMSNILIDDGMDGSVFVERLLLAPDALVVLSRSQRRGNIFGSERIDTWAQVVGKRTLRFANPLYALDEAIAGLRAQVGDVPISAKVVFSGECEFPKGKPEGMLTLDDLAALDPLTEQSRAVGATIQAAWDKLGAMAETVTDKRVLGEDEDGKPGRLGAALALLALGAAWLAWRLG